MKVKNAVKFSLVVVLTLFLTYLALNDTRIPGTNFVVPQFKIKGGRRFFGWQDNIVPLPGAKNTRTGIDIRGGVRVIFEPDVKLDGSAVTDQDMESIRAKIEARLDNKQIFDKSVLLEKGKKRAILEIPWPAGETNFVPEQVIKELGEVALLTFRELEEPKPQELNANPTNEPPKPPSLGNIIVEGKDVKSATVEYNIEDGSYVSLEFNDKASKQFEEATGRLIGKPIAIYMDDILISAPTVQTKISGGKAQITLGKADKTNKAQNERAKQAKDLADKISAGSLPVKLKTIDYETISPTLGESALKVSLVAGAVSLLLVWMFMFVYYRLPGVLANIALLAHTAIQLLFISWTGITLTLPGIAGVILTIGMGVDANVIIFERIKEELKNGKTLRSAIDIGFKRAFQAILDANLTTLISGGVLYMFGSGPIKSFAITLMLGVVLSFFTAVTVSRIMLKSVADINIAKHRWLYGA